jgi:hypothetical protein
MTGWGRKGRKRIPIPAAQPLSLTHPEMPVMTRSSHSPVAAFGRQENCYCDNVLVRARLFRVSHFFLPHEYCQGDHCQAEDRKDA